MTTEQFYNELDILEDDPYTVEEDIQELIAHYLENNNGQ